MIFAVEEDVLNGPLNSGLKPAPSSSSAAILPRVTTRPAVGLQKCRRRFCSRRALAAPVRPDEAERLAFLDK